MSETSVIPLKVAGIGGAGGNAMLQMYSQDTPGVEFIVMNTDRQALQYNPCPNKVLLSGHDIAENHADIVTALDGAKMAVLVAGLGGNTGTGAVSAIAQVCKERGIPVICLVTMPLAFEGKKRAERAEEGLERLLRVADGTAVLPTEQIMLATRQNSTMKDFFSLVDGVLARGLHAISEISKKNTVTHANIETCMGPLKSEGFTVYLRHEEAH